MELPDDIVREIFQFFTRLEKRFKNRGRIYSMEYPLKDWKSLMSVCKQYLRIGREIFDPSINYNRAFRNACHKGYVKLNLLFTLGTQIMWIIYCMIRESIHKLEEML